MEDSCQPNGLSSLNREFTYFTYLLTLLTYLCTPNTTRSGFLSSFTVKDVSKRRCFGVYMP